MQVSIQIVRKLNFVRRSFFALLKFSFDGPFLLPTHNEIATIELKIGISS